MIFTEKNSKKLYTVILTGLVLCCIIYSVFLSYEESQIGVNLSGINLGLFRRKKWEGCRLFREKNIIS